VTLYTPPKVYHVVAALIRRRDDLLLVKQQGPDDLEAYWALPGGVVEAGELLPLAVAREVREETGLRVAGVGSLLYVCQVEAVGSRTIAFIFTVDCRHGDAAFADPDGLVSEAFFVPTNDAIRLLSYLSYPPMRDPLLAYLRGEASPGTIWCYRQDASGTYTLESP